MADVDGVQELDGPQPHTQSQKSHAHSVGSPSSPLQMHNGGAPVVDGVVDDVMIATRVTNDVQFEGQSEAPTLSKNQQKKLKRKQEWEDGREARKARRKEKNKERKIRRRTGMEQREAAGHSDSRQHNAAIDPLTNSSLGIDASETGNVTDTVHEKHGLVGSSWKEQKKRYRAVQLPLTFIYDCAFDDLMTDNERISLASQLTRAYSDNRKAKYRAQVVVASFNGNLRERFEGILGGHHEHWKGVKFTEDDFVHAAKQARGDMQTTVPDQRAYGSGLSQESALDHGKPFGSRTDNGTVNDTAEGGSMSDIFGKGFESEPETVYLTSDSPNTLEYLRPFSTYIIGALVDKNRHKGICYKRACDHGVKTAKLPIGEYMRMSSRQVLATNHVGEIMLKWLEGGCNWGQAFESVIPKRKGGVLKGPAENEGNREVDNSKGEAD